MRSPIRGTGSSGLRQWLTLFAIIGTFAINAWSNINPLFGLTIGEISNQFFSDVLIIPANYAFAIWGLIYLGLIAFGVYQLLPAQRDHPRLQHIDGWLILACVVQAIWVFLFLARWFAGSLVAMVGILLPLLMIYRQLESAQSAVSRQERWFVTLPLRIYLGWISVATIVNVAIVLSDLGWNGWGLAPEIWTVVMAGIAAAIAVWLAVQQRDAAYPLVIAWALGAIAVRHRDIPLIAFSTGGLAIALVVLVGLINLRKRTHT